MSIKIALLGFWYCCQWCSFPFERKINQKITEAAHDTIEITKVLVKDDDGKKSFVSCWK